MYVYELARPQFASRGLGGGGKPPCTGISLTSLSMQACCMIISAKTRCVCGCAASRRCLSIVTASASGQSWHICLTLDGQSKCERKVGVNGALEDSCVLHRLRAEEVMRCRFGLSCVLQIKSVYLRWTWILPDVRVEGASCVRYYIPTVNASIVQDSTGLVTFTAS